MALDPLALIAAAGIAIVAQPAAATPRDTLTRAAFATPGKAQALALIQSAIDETQATLAKAPNDREARLQNAIAIGYRGQIRRSPGDAKSARDLLAGLGRDYPRDPEVQVALAGWNLTAVADLGPFLARTLLGADKASGMALLGRAQALGGNKPFYTGFGALIRLEVSSSDTQAALALATRAASDPATTPLDRIMQRAAQRLLVPLRAGNGAAAAKLAHQLLPFGNFI